MSPNPETPECVFCRIAEGLEPARLVHSDARTLAFLPLHPAVDGHVLVVPRHHVRDAWELDEPTSLELTRAVRRVVRAVRSAYAPEGMNIITSVGAVATQSVMHLHIHVVPRDEGDRMGPIWPSQRTVAPVALDEMADRLRGALTS
ncbi:HIT family protein [Streptomyces sp. NEAU-Y11]|uniref:HIT family protein n=1 Tax=Streptomyces cucumeris TaxID=2962890 RepID=UPI0020C8486B|nr:HIT family protein [Streptomyces sp. NEAU-Y11]MCP9208360.1 HIT family protein [Streptomyces sp. NEAU-Y11]